MNLDHLALPPFSLNNEQIRWVEATAGELGPSERIAQLFNLGVFGPGDGWREKLKHLKPGGITRFFSGSHSAEKRLIEEFQSDARVPFLVSATREFFLRRIQILSLFFHFVPIGMISHIARQETQGWSRSGLFLDFPLLGCYSRPKGMTMSTIAEAESFGALVRAEKKSLHSQPFVIRW